MRRNFIRRKVLLPVIHVENREQALANCRIAIEAGADGVFLVNHNVHTVVLMEAFNAARRNFPDLWIGLNFLDLPDPAEAFMVLPEDADGLWVDNARVRCPQEDQEYIQAARMTTSQRKGKKTYFGGIAFKYQMPDPDPAGSAAIAVRLMDVVTTSGTKTGSAPDIEKIRSMKEAIGVHPLPLPAELQQKM